MPTRLLIFDFDGLVLDTESPELAAWQEVYRQRGVELPLARWYDCIGRRHAYFDPYTHLAQLTRRPVDRDAIRSFRKARRTEILATADLRPGVRDYLEQSRRMGLKRAIASSSTHEWVEGYLTRFGVLDAFDALVCAEDTTAHKPDPAPYLEALRRLEIHPEHAIALEDSPNGIAAARAAGIFTVAVPNDVTRHLSMAGANLVLHSLADMPLTQLLKVRSSPRAVACLCEEPQP